MQWQSIFSERLVNTVFEYLYRDGSNYKQWGAVIFDGEIVPALRNRFQRALESQEFFIADQIQVPEAFPPTWPIYADDHCWHEFAAFETTTDPATDSLLRTIEQFVIDVERASACGWRDFDPGDRMR